MNYYLITYLYFVFFLILIQLLSIYLSDHSNQQIPTSETLLNELDTNQLCSIIHIKPEYIESILNLLSLKENIDQYTYSLFPFYYDLLFHLDQYPNPIQILTFFSLHPTIFYLFIDHYELFLSIWIQKQIPMDTIMDLFMNLFPIVQSNDDLLQIYKYILSLLYYMMSTRSQKNVFVFQSVLRQLTSLLLTLNKTVKPFIRCQLVPLFSSLLSLLNQSYSMSFLQLYMNYLKLLFFTEIEDDELIRISMK